MRLRIAAGTAFALVVLALTATAGAAPSGAGSCSGGLVAGGTYNGYTVTGNCFFAGDPVTINGNLTIADGASLNAHAATLALVHVI